MPTTAILKKVKTTTVFWCVDKNDVPDDCEDAAAAVGRRAPAAPLGFPWPHQPAPNHTLNQIYPRQQTGKTWTAATAKR